jgi:hypothetical protein
MLPLGIDLPGRDEAQEAARRELERRAYDEARPPWTARLIQWVLDKLSELLASASGLPGGGLGVALLVLLVGILVAIAVARLRPTVRDPRSGDLFGAGHLLTAAEHRDLADAAAAQGDYAEAVRERLRAVVRHLEERGLLDPRPGRTAAEVSREAGRTVPALVEPLGRAATTFERIWYGGQVADASSYAVLVEVDRVVGQTRMAAP